MILSVSFLRVIARCSDEDLAWEPIPEEDPCISRAQVGRIHTREYSARCRSGCVTRSSAIFLATNAGSNTRISPRDLALARIYARGMKLAIGQKCGSNGHRIVATTRAEMLSRIQKKKKKKRKRKRKKKKKKKGKKKRKKIGKWNTHSDCVC